MGIINLIKTESDRELKLFSELNIISQNFL